MCQVPEYRAVEVPILKDTNNKKRKKRTIIEKYIKLEQLARIAELFCFQVIIYILLRRCVKQSLCIKFVLLGHHTLKITKNYSIYN